MPQSMGIGLLGQPKTIIKRKFRFTLEWELSDGTKIPMHFVKVANRPQLEINEVEFNFLNAVHYIAGKGRFQPMNVTYVDASHLEMVNLYKWVSQVYNFNLYGGYLNTLPNGLYPQGKGDNLVQSEPDGYMAKGILKIFDGCGNELEEWTLLDCFPTSINFGDLSYESSEECTIDLTIRYSKATLTGKCVPIPTVDCKGCATNVVGN